MAKPTPDLADEAGVGMKRIFIASGAREGTVAFPSFTSPLQADSNDGPGSSRGPSPLNLLSRSKGLVRYQQSGSSHQRPQGRCVGRHDAGTLIGFLDQHYQGSVDPQAELGRRACGELVANPTPVHN